MRVRDQGGESPAHRYLAREDGIAVSSWSPDAAVVKHRRASRALARPAYAIQVWEHSPGRWITVETENSRDAALDVGARLAPIEPDVRVTELGVSIARWLMGQRTIS